MFGIMGGSGLWSEGLGDSHAPLFFGEAFFFSQCFLAGVEAARGVLP